MSFKVISEITVDGEEFQLVEHIEFKRLAIRQRYDNVAGQTSRTCPTIWLDILPSYLKAAAMLLIQERKDLGGLT